MLTLPTPSTKGKPKDGSKVGGLWVDLAEDGSEDGTSTPVEKDPGTLPPAPSKTEAGMIPPVPTKIEAGTTPEHPTGPKQNGTPIPVLPATPSSESTSSDDDTEEEYVSGFVELLGPNAKCKRMMDDKTRMLAHHRTKTVNKAIPIFQQVVNEDPELFIEARAQITAAV
jgi:hypothetical protein